LKDCTLDNLTKSIADSLLAGINANGHASLVACGGSSPLSLYKNLSVLDLDWSKVSIFLGDDRIVSSDHPDSNEYLITHYLLKNKAISATFYPLKDFEVDKDEDRYTFDIVLLGLGSDGHFASLFPAQIENNQAFDVNASPAIIISQENLGSPSYKRLSMNLSMLLDARRCILLVPNTEKRNIVDRALNDNQLPLHYLLTQQKTKIEFSDIDFK
jgi:6-phosphogluconolactonase